jgi:hypothetical protein
MDQPISRYPVAYAAWMGDSAAAWAHAAEGIQWTRCWD